MTDVTRVLAEYVCDFEASDVPGDVADRVSLHLVDTVAATVVGASMPWTDSVRHYALSESATGSSSAVGVEASLRPEYAAMVNATAAHGFEIDDYALPALSHAGCVVVPAALAVAEDIGASTAEFNTALALGYEVVLRLSAAMTPALTSVRSFHVTSVLGVIGAAVTAARLHRLDRTSVAHALGIAAAHAGGTAEFTRSGGDVKRIHAGMAAAGGIRSAALARHGCTAPARSIEGERGYLAAFSSEADASIVTGGLGTRWLVDQLAIKKYSVCGGLQAPLAALAELRAAGLDTDAVESISVGLDRATLAHVGSIGPEPETLTSAQLSVHHAAATMLILGGTDPQHYSALADSPTLQGQVAALARRVTAYVDDAAQLHFPRRLFAEVSIDVRGSDRATVRAEAPGTPHRSMSTDEVHAKFHRLTTPILGESAGAALLDAALLPAGATVTGIGSKLKTIPKGKWPT